MADLIFQMILLSVYFMTVFSFIRKLKHFPGNAMRREIRSFKIQFLMFFIGFLVQAIYIIYMIADPVRNFYGECFRTVIVIVSFLAPIWVIIYAQ